MNACVIKFLLFLKRRNLRAKKNGVGATRIFCLCSSTNADIAERRLKVHRISGTLELVPELQVALPP